ncbi:MAG TPA: hypothetical protein VJH22_04245 [Candidatus Nanoarchaeia archaeon]|nr:hypothetical protein [Candidatus Nanoarchaeia archaeon]
MRVRAPDPSHARSLVEASKQEMAFLETLPKKIDAGSTLIRGIYENFRRLGMALLLLDGITTQNHETAIKRLIDLPKMNTTRPLRTLDQLRKLRHDINYQGYQPTQADLNEAVSIKNACWKPLYEEVSKRVSDSIKNQASTTEQSPD